MTSVWLITCSRSKSRSPADEIFGTTSVLLASPMHEAAAGEVEGEVSLPLHNSSLVREISLAAQIHYHEPTPGNHHFAEAGSWKTAEVAYQSVKSLRIWLKLSHWSQWCLRSSPDKCRGDLTAFLEKTWRKIPEKRTNRYKWVKSSLPALWIPCLEMMLDTACYPATFIGDRVSG